ncbi:hypothetical protein CFIO01_04256 [Colletotrichum fioriniae PJ7]|uniref:Uncharacterized protein n=1 Tax=Colletotrichum fioriniae PJ7 TaxID=1445577 RepID=A0A010RRC2_9PEZI|nr:hypothetical protein CFIO01_04256 [Colletotrichum fioriniae PJ7]
MLSDGRRKHLSDLSLILGTLSADVDGGEQDRFPSTDFTLQEQANNSGTGADANESRFQGSTTTTTPVTQLPKFGLPSELEDPRVIVIKKDEKIFKIAYASAQGPKGPTRQSPLQRCHHMVMVTARAAASGSTLSTPNRIATHRFSEGSWIPHRQTPALTKRNTFPGATRSIPIPPSHLIPDKVLTAPS